MAISAKQFFKQKDTFFDYREAIYGISPQTLKSNRADLALFESFVTSEKIKSINGKAVIDFQYHLKNHRNNCGASINRKIFTLRSFGNFLKLADVPNAQNLPFYDVLKIRQGYRKRPDALTPAQISLLLRQVEPNTILGLRDYALYALMYQLGLRVGEVHRINLSDMDLEQQKVTVIGKGNKPRTLHINDELLEVVSHYLAVRDRFYNSWLTPALFISKKGNRLAIRTMEDNFKKLVHYAGIQVPFNVTCHTLRHSLASHLNDKDTDILVIKSILGHASTRSTEPYIHPSMERIRKAMEKLPGVIFVNKLIKRGELDLSFQKRLKRKLE